MAEVAVKNLSKTFGPNRPAVTDVSLTIPEGESCVILGPSGSGKSTLLRMIAGLETPDTGTVTIDGKDVAKVPPHHRGIGFLGQRPALYPQLCVQDHLQGSPEYQQEWIDRLKLGPLLKRLPHQLSVGEQQRVALARLGTGKARLWLLDEPFSALDPVLRAEFRAELHLLIGLARATMITVTHDPPDAWALGRCVGVLEAGALTQLGKPDVLALAPNTSFVAVSLGRLCLWTGQVTCGDSGGAIHFTPSNASIRLTLPAAYAAVLKNRSTDNLTLGFRLEDVLPTPRDANSVAIQGFTVTSAEPVGSGWAVTFCQGSTWMKGLWPTGSPPPVGLSPTWYWTPTRCDLFEPRTGARVVAH